MTWARHLLLRGGGKQPLTIIVQAMEVSHLSPNGLGSTAPPRIVGILDGAPLAVAPGQTATRIKG